MPGVFISHTQTDRPIAEAIALLLRNLFSKKIAVNYSSSKELDGGIAPGADWFNWIVDQVRGAEMAFIVLTPSSIQKPWVVWEAGAVAGAAYATAKTGKAQGDDRRVCPITFGLTTDDIPSPFARTQLVKGSDASEIKKLTQDLFRRFAPILSDDEKGNFGEQRRDAEKQYLKTLDSILHKIPHTITEASVQEWLLRLDQLEKEGRSSEAAVIEDWLDISFGREDDDRARPLDVRIHRRLGELFARAAMAPSAARQFELARRLAPRDIFLLRRLGKAHLDGGDVEKASKVIAEIQALDDKAFTRNIESAALKARWCEQSGDLRSAREVLDAAYRAIPTSYYLGDRLGQLLLKQGAVNEAREIYRQVLVTIRKTDEHNIWSSATGIAAAIVLGDQTNIDLCLSEIRELRPSREQKESIARGLAVVVEAVAADHKILERVRGLSD